MNKIWIITVSIIAMVCISVLIGLNLTKNSIPTENGDEPSLPDKSTNLPSVLWQKDLDNFISDIVSDEKRVYVVDGVNVFCFNTTNGEEIWRSNNIGYTTSRSKLVLYEEKIYAGTYGGMVTSFNKYTGKELLQFQAPVSTTWGGKQTPQNFFIEGGRLFVFQNGYAVFNASTGELFYENNGWTIKLGTANPTAFNGVFISQYGNGRVNPNNGEIIWSVSGSFSDPAIVSHDKVIFWNYNPAELGYLDLGEFIFCVDASSGDTLWSYNVSSPMFRPTIYNELVLFVGYDSYFYALNLTNGDLAWKTLAINQNQTKIIGDEGQDLTPVVSPIQIETKKKQRNLEFCTHTRFLEWSSRI
jgi:outer membrane protein assembly factor BamB